MGFHKYSVMGELAKFLDVGARARSNYTCFTQHPAEVTALFSEANPWFHANQDAKLLAGDFARMAVFAPRDGLDLIEVDGERVCFFGFFEAIDDSEETRAEVEHLFAQAARWARAQGADKLYGPIDFSTFGDYRLKTSQEDGGLPFAGEPHNPAFYHDLLVSVGARQARAYITQVFASQDIAKKRAKKSAARDALVASGYTFGALSVSFWMEHLERLHGLTDSIFGSNFAYTPLPLQMFKAACGESFVRKCDPDASVVCLAPDGTIAGLFLVYPHYGALLAEGGQISTRALDFKNHLAAIDTSAMPNTAIMKTVGVRRDLRRAGIMDSLTVEVFERGADRYERWFGALIRDDNPSRNFADGVHPEQRTYALYSWGV